MATCIDCGGDIRWLRFATSGKAIAVNETRVIGGNVDLDDNGRAFVIKASAMVAHYLPHAATCPEIEKQRAEEAKSRRAARDKKNRSQLKLF